MNQNETLIEVDQKNAERQKRYLNEIHKRLEEQRKEKTENDHI